MSRNGSGVYSLPAGNPVVTGTTISSTWANNTLSDIGTALTQSIASDGQTVPTANLPMGGFKHTNVDDATSATEYLTAGQAVNGAAQYLQTVSGADTITASGSFTPGGYVAGQTYYFIAAGSNTTAVTLNVAGLGAKDLKKRASGGLVALVANDLISGLEYSVTYDGTQFVLNEQRPYSQGAAIASAATVDLNVATGDYVHITGTTSITAITLAQGEQRTIVFDGILTFTNSASLILPGGLNITTAANDVAVVRGEASGVVRCVNYVKANGSFIAPQTIVSSSVRQTIVSGPVDSSGFSAFGGSTGSTSVTASGTLIFSAAAASVNYTGSITNPSWTGLSTNGTMYLYLDITAAGIVSTGSTTLAPVYQWGGTYSTTNNQHTFNIQEMTMKVGNGSSANQVYRVFAGEVTVAGNVVTAITWYALMGRYDSGYTNTLPGVNTTISKNHNIGVIPRYAALQIKCLTAELGYSVGDVVEPMTNTNNGEAIFTPGRAYKSISFKTGSTSAFRVVNPTDGTIANLTAASWAYKVVSERGW